MGEEILKQIPEYPDYSVSNYGNVYSMKGKKPRLMKYRNNYGYKIVNLYLSGKVRTLLVHRLALSTFTNKPLYYEHQVNHINEDKSDNHIDNLQWTTSKENMVYSTAKPFMDLDGHIYSSSREFCKAHGCSRVIVHHLLRGWIPTKGRHVGIKLRYLTDEEYLDWKQNLIK